MRKPIIISIEGNIGSGKTSLIRSLKRYNSLCENKRNDIYFMPEPVTSWTEVEDDEDHILNLFYSDKKKYSLAFQTLIATIYRSKIHEIIRTHPGVKYIITERSLYTSYLVFSRLLRDEGYMTPIEYKVYESLFLDNSTDWMFPDRMIYVDTSVDVCLQRIANRQTGLRAQGNNSRENETLIDKRYLELVKTTHENLSNFRPNREALMRLNGDAEDTATRDSWPAEIMQNIERADKRYSDADEYLNIKFTHKGFMKRTNMFLNDLTIEQMINEIYRLFPKIKKTDRIWIYWRELAGCMIPVSNTRDVLDAIQSMKEDGSYLYRFEVETTESREQIGNLRRSDRLKTDSPDSDLSSQGKNPNPNSSSSSSNLRPNKTTNSSSNTTNKNPSGANAKEEEQLSAQQTPPSTPVNMEIMRPTTIEREITSMGRRNLYGIISPPIFKTKRGKPYHGLG
jgi:deoxyadenosine/deoxycytidine kinase